MNRIDLGACIFLGFVPSMQPFNDPISERVIACAMKVHRALGFGFVESVFHRAMEIELARNHIHFESEKRLDVFYEGRLVGHFEADLIVEDRLVLELKACEQTLKAHEVQLVNYLTAANIESGLLLNFGAQSLGIRRKFKRCKSSKSNPVNPANPVNPVKKTGTFYA